jgi:hypothetical protein
MFKDKIIVEGLWNVGNDANSMRNKMSTHIQNVTIEVFEITKENKRESKDTWW